MNPNDKAIQTGLAGHGYDVGPIDGNAGPRTLKAAQAWIDADGKGKASGGAWPKPANVAAFYGPAGGPDCTAGRVNLPFAFPLAWDGDQRVTRVSCHIKVAASFQKIWTDAAGHYGEARFRELRLDQFGGCFAYRQMRGGTSLSMHSWGIAWDVDSINNQLRWGADKASLDGPEYLPFWRIVESQGAKSLGRTSNYDWMHFEFTS